MTITVTVVVLAVLGAGLGFVADWLSVRWPEHEPDYQPRGLDWRTLLLISVGAVVFGGVAAQWTDTRDLVILIAFSAALLVLLATDLDQKLLPDAVTLPLIVGSAIVLILGWSPLLAGKELALISGIAAAIIAPVFLFLSDRLLRGDLGGGDLKLSVSIGLMCGISLLVTGLLVASIGFSVVLIALIVARRIGLRSAVPFGPVLIAAAFVAILLG
jgi:leader peptidase (prepilin peptidase) / N-methyltransferase